LPVWNCFVIYIVISVAWLLIKIETIFLVTLAFLLMEIF